MRKLLVPTFLATVAATPAAGAAVGPIAPVLPGSDSTPSASTATRSERAAIEREAARQKKAAVRRARARHERRSRVSIPPQLAAIASCESGGNPRAIGGGGAFRGKYQFTYSTWAEVGGKGDPAAAPEAEQDRRAAMLYSRSGPGQWPICGR